MRKRIVGFIEDTLPVRVGNGTVTCRRNLSSHTVASKRIDISTRLLFQSFINAIIIVESSTHKVSGGFLTLARIASKIQSLPAPERNNKGSHFFLLVVGPTTLV